MNRAVIGMGTAGAFALINFRQRMHALVLKKVVKFFSNTKLRKILVQDTKLQKLSLFTHTL